MSEDATTRPTIETVLERLSALDDRLSARLDILEIRLDRIESMTTATRVEMLTLRTDFREFRAQGKESA
jgi:hypothetical protein